MAKYYKRAEMAWACCLFCRKEFLTRYHKSTCLCKEAKAAQREQWRKNDRSWRRERYKGKIHHTDKDALKGHRAKFCNHVSPNIFWCSVCLKEKEEIRNYPGDCLGQPLGSGW